MRIIKVLATDSTNLFLRELYRESPEMGNCVVVTEHQTRGKGQMGATWVAEPGKNLTFSLLLTNLNLPLDQQFKLSAIVAMALADSLKSKKLKNVIVKWPNDILADGYKVCGILIENILQGGRVENTIVGIGLNVNQTNFKDFPQASSLKLRSGTTYDLEELLNFIAKKIEAEVYAQIKLPMATILEKYERYLFRWKKPSTFQFPDGKQQTGMIQKVTPQGRLQVLFENEQVKDFDIKEIKLLY